MAPVILCHRSIPTALDQRPHHRQDICAPRGLRHQLLDAFTGSGLKGLVLLATDILALGLSWHLARSLNQFFSPIPPQLVWWN